MQPAKVTKANTAKMEAQAATEEAPQVKSVDKIVAHNDDAVDDGDKADQSADHFEESSSSSSTTQQSETSSTQETSESSEKSTSKTQRTITRKVVTTKTSSTTSTSSSSSSFMSPTADICFKLQPYEEREEAQTATPTTTPTTTTTVHEERRVVSEQKTLSELRTKDALTGEEQLVTSAESKSSSARFKKISSNDNLLDLADVEQLQPLTATVSAETRLTERLENPQDKQSIETGILTLSECGKQLQLSENGGISYTECEQTEQQTYLEGQQILNEQPVDVNAQPTLEREFSETLTVSKDGEKQVTKRLEQSKETPCKKGAKLLKKTDEERRLEQEAQKIIESYQKVKKETEKLYNLQLADDEQGFDLSAFEQVEPHAEQQAEAEVVQPEEELVKEEVVVKEELVKEEVVKEEMVKEEIIKPVEEVTVHEQLEITLPAVEDDLGYVLHKNIIDPPKPEIVIEELIKEAAPKAAPKATPKPKPPLPSAKPKVSPTIVKPKTAPPPVPSKRSELGLGAKPTPTQRRSSLELQSPPKPLERIIVGVEQTEPSPIINLASVDLPNVAPATVVPHKSNANDNLLAQAVDLLQDELHFESHKLPNAEKQREVEGEVTIEGRGPEQGQGQAEVNGIVLSASSSMTSTASSSSSAATPITTPILVSATSSLDSVKSVIEVINGHATDRAEGHSNDNSCNSLNGAVVVADDTEPSEEHVENVSTLTLDREHETGKCLSNAWLKGLRFS